MNWWICGWGVWGGSFNFVLVSFLFFWPWIGIGWMGGLLTDQLAQVTLLFLWFVISRGYG
jgi:hypothetical protein